jgi:hypothetical protein
MTTLRGDISVLQCGHVLQGLKLPQTLLLWTNTAALNYLKTLLTILQHWCIRANLCSKSTDSISPHAFSPHCRLLGPFCSNAD